MRIIPPSTCCTLPVEFARCSSPYSLDNSPHRSLDIFFDEILAAPTTQALVLGLYEHAIPAVHSALGALLHDTNRFFDHPTYRVARFAAIEFSEVLEYAGSAVRALVTDADCAALSTWVESLHDILTHAGGLEETSPDTVAEPTRTYSVQPFRYNAVPQRDERFIDPYNMGVNAEAMLFNQSPLRTHSRLQLGR